MGKILDLTTRINKNPKKTKPQNHLAPVFSIIEPRLAILSEERRQLRRTILTEFVGAFVLLSGRGLMRVSLFDISDNGLSFELEQPQGEFQEGEKIAMRIYLNQKTFFEFVLEVKWKEYLKDEQLVRHGCRLVKNTVNDVALFHFVKFIEAVSVNLRVDEGDLQISSKA